MLYRFWYTGKYKCWNCLTNREKRWGHLAWHVISQQVSHQVCFQLILVAFDVPFPAHASCFLRRWAVFPFCCRCYHCFVIVLSWSSCFVFFGQRLLGFVLGHAWYLFLSLLLAFNSVVVLIVLGELLAAVFCLLVCIVLINFSFSIVFCNYCSLFEFSIFLQLTFYGSFSGFQSNTNPKFCYWKSHIMVLNTCFCWILTNMSNQSCCPCVMLWPQEPQRKQAWSLLV